MSLFQQGKFKSHSGLILGWKIECDDLSKSDLQTLAKLVSEVLNFGYVHGVPSGGYEFARHLEKYARPNDYNTTLVVDDVMTTGDSILDEMSEYMNPMGLVIFNRSGKKFKNVYSIFDLNKEFV